ncbi:hypothetical protein AX762_08115 [Alkalibacterium sp. 20]|nr:hypothetical protein AX762_08115 [Alkalibacterium sp. 20]
MIEQSDDSAGSVGSLLMGIEGELQDRLNQVSMDTKTKLSLLKKLEKTVNLKIYEGWETLAIDLLGIFSTAVPEKQVREAYVDLIDKKTEKFNKENQPYTVSVLLKLKASVIRTYESEDTYKDFLYTHEEDRYMKKELIQYLLEKKAYSDVLDRLDLDDGSKPLHAKRDQLRHAYQAYAGMNETDKQIETGKKLILAGEFEYYEKIKAIAEDPEDLYTQTKQSIQAMNSFEAFHLYKKLIIVEQDTEAILSLTKNNPALIEETINYLKDAYPEETFTLYTRYMYQLAEESSNRKEYKVLCRKLNTYGELFGSQEKSTVISHLEETYNRRPAMKDELSKIK